MRRFEERFFTTEDGARIFYRYLSPAAATNSPPAILLLHRGHEHSGRMQHLADELDLPEFAMFAWDARGHGRSVDGSERNPTMATFVKDLDTWARHIADEFGIAMENMAVVGQSIGSVLAATWVHDFAPPIRAMVLGTPAFKVKLYVPFARTALGAGQKLLPDMTVKSYIKPTALTHDLERIASYRADPLIKRPISVKLLLALYSTSDRVIADAPAIRTPTQLLISGSDYVVHRRPQDEFFDRLGSAIKERHVFDGFFHDTLGEKDRHLAVAKARDFIRRCFREAPARTSLRAADRAGFTFEEYESLRRPLAPLSVKNLNFGISRLAMRTGGRLSAGIRLGLETGFDSGSTLDYIYRNQPDGTTIAGKWIDWIYLNAIGWRGIRMRRYHLERMLVNAMSRLEQHGRSIRILDIAAGPGRYILEALWKSNGGGPRVEQILLRDYSEINIRRGQELIRELGFEKVARYEMGDAFDRRSLCLIRPQATVGVVSGLYELFPDNDMVAESLCGLAGAIEKGSYLIYTGQPWHPQIEMIARVLSSHRGGRPWVMRRRTQAEMDELVESSGFRKIDQYTDEWGIFTVSLAQRLGA